MNNSARAIPIDLLRILAASCIFYVHAGLLTQWPLALWGEFAVATFIYLTAFCTVRYSKGVAGRLRPYWWARFKAIYPTFAVICIIIFAASFVFKPAKAASHYSLADFAANISMIAGYIGRPWLTEPIWFIPFVLQVYLILHFLIKVPSRWWVLPVSFIIAAAACTVIYVLSPTNLDHAYGRCRNWSPLFRLPEVLIGCLVARALTLSDVVAPILIYGACCVVAVLLTLNLYPPAMPLVLLFCKGVIVFFVLAAVVMLITPMMKDDWAPFIGLLGRASFPFFLLHGTGIGVVFHKFGTNLLAWIIYFFLSWIAAVIFIVVPERFNK